MYDYDCVWAGVVWKGDKLIDGVSEALDLLRSKVFVFLILFRVFYGYNALCLIGCCYVTGEEAYVRDQQFLKV